MFSIVARVINMMFFNTSVAKYCKQAGDENKEIHQPTDIILIY